MNRMKIAPAYACAIVLCLPIIAWADSPGAFDSKSFDALSQADRYEFVIAALRAQESQLRNFSYALRATISEMNAQGEAQPPFAVDDIEFSRLGVQTLIHDAPTRKGQKRDETWSSFDGRLRRSRSLRADGKYTGRIADSEIGLVNDTYYNAALGFRIEIFKANTSIGLSRSQWLMYMRDTLGHPITITSDSRLGAASVKVQVQLAQTDQQTLWFDPGRDFTMTESDYEAKYGKDDSGYSRTHVIDAKQVDGLWVPAHVVQIRNNSVKHGPGTQYDYIVSKFSRDRVTDKDFVVTFVPGSPVVDNTKNEAFKVMADGTLEPIPIYDPAAGLVKKPGQTSAEVFAAARAPFHSGGQSGIAIWIEVAVAAALLIVGYSVYRRWQTPSH